MATPPFDGKPIQFVDVFPLTPDRRVDLFPASAADSAIGGLYVFKPDPGTAEYPLALISPSSEKTISSTLGELRTRAAVLQMHPSDAAERGLAPDDPVRIFNDLGEVQCPVALNADVRPGTVSLPKGLWRKSTYNGSTTNALVPDTSDGSRATVRASTTHASRWRCWDDIEIRETCTVQRAPFSVRVQGAECDVPGAGCRCRVLVQGASGQPTAGSAQPAAASAFQ